MLASQQINKALVYRPLLGFASCYILGTWLAFFFSLSFFFLILAPAVLFISLSVFFRRKKLKSKLFLNIGIIFAAWLIAILHPVGAVPKGSLGKMVDGNAVVSGVVVSDPELKLLDDAFVSRFQFRVEDLRAEKSLSPLMDKGMISISLYGKTFDGNKVGSRTMPSYGDRWLINGKVRQKRSFGRKRSYFLNEEYYFTGNLYGSRLVSRDNGSGFVASCYRARRSAARYLSLGIEGHPIAVRLVQAVLLGYRGNMTPETKKIFSSTATLHIFAISGLHVGIVAGIMVFVLKLFRVSRIYWGLFVIPLLIEYTILTGARASAVRACVMAVVYFLAPLLGRKADNFSALSFSAILILAVAPAHLFNVGFIYSFVVVLSLIILYPSFNELLKRYWEKDPLSIQEESKYMVMFRGGGKYVASLVSLSCSAWLASMPLTAYFFGRFTPVSLLSNLLVVPLAFLIVLFGILSIVLGSCLELFSHILNHIVLALVSILIWLMKGVSFIPFGSIDVPKPSALVVVFWYVLLGLIFVRFIKIKREG